MTCLIHARRDTLSCVLCMFLYFTEGANLVGCIAFFLLVYRGALFDLFFITEGAQFACFSPSLKRGNLGVFVLFLKKGAHCPCFFFYFISLAEGGATPHFFSLQRGRSLCFCFLIPGGERNFLLFPPLFLFSSLPFFVVFNYGLPSDFEFKETRFHLYIMYFDKLNIISVLKEMKKSLTS